MTFNFSYSQNIFFNQKPLISMMQKCFQTASVKSKLGSTTAFFLLKNEDDILRLIYTITLILIW